MPRVVVHEHTDETGDAQCLACTSKHLGHAAVFLQEAASATDPARIRAKMWRAMAQLVAAESQAKDWGLGKEIRALRKRVEEAATENRVCCEEEVSALGIRALEMVQGQGAHLEEIRRAEAEVMGRAGLSEGCTLHGDTCWAREPCGTCDHVTCRTPVDTPLLVEARGVEVDPKTMSIAQSTLAGLNRHYGLQVGLETLGVEDLKRLGLNQRYMGFVAQNEPTMIRLIPQNIPNTEEVRRTIVHEYRHVLDLLGGCVHCSREERERRAREFEATAPAGVAS